MKPNGLYILFDRFLLAVESCDLSQPDKNRAETICGTHYSVFVEFMDLLYLKSTLGLSEQEQVQLNKDHHL